MSEARTHSHKQLARKALALAIAAALSAPVQAQDSQTEAEDNMLEEVIVTASKRETTLQDLSMSVTAINPEMMSRAEILDVTRLDTLVPGMQFASSGNEVRIALRGTRQNNVGTEAEQSVGIFEDGVYVPTSTQALGSYVDVQRIEVLRGPQGTLYGRNTFGGTINIITNDPTFDEFYGSVSGLYGDYDRYRVEAIANIPLSETFALRVAGMLDQHDGYIENTWVPGTSDDLNDRDITFLRVGAKWLVTDNFMATFGIAYNNTEIKDKDLSVVPCGSTLCEAWQNRDENGQVSIDGNPFPRTPETNYSLTLRYGMPVGNDGEFFVFTDWVYYGEILMPLYYSPEFVTDNQFEGGLKVGYRNTRDNWEVALFGRNITDEDNVKGFVDFSNNTGFVNEPAIWGIQATYNFGQY